MAMGLSEAHCHAIIVHKILILVKEIWIHSIRGYLPKPWKSLVPHSQLPTSPWLHWRTALPSRCWSENRKVMRQRQGLPHERGGEQQATRTCSRICRRWRCASRGVIFSSVIKRSILFSTKTGLMLSIQAWRNTACVCKGDVASNWASRQQRKESSEPTWGQTPSTQSTRMMAPSHNRTAVETSLEKSMWPGESIKLMR